ncbi:hypothetical protein Dimus_000248 [Dionaea muscipula]
MPVAGLKTSGSAGLMKSEDENDSIDTIIRQAIGKEPFLSFTRAGDSPVQWIQLLHAFDRQDAPGWPLFSPVKVQMQKCEKCSSEFCSTINYRRHMRLHRRSLNLDKDSAAKNRDYLQVYWDKLSTDEAVEVLSFKDVTLEEVTGSSIIMAMTSFIRKPGFTSLPHAYVKAGSALLDIIQGRPTRFPLTAQELFGLLDDASENTFLCAGTAESLQKFVFDGEAGKIGLEIRNLIACTSFLIEQKLVKAWLADKDAEALRCQKMLVEEEEAAQKRLAALLEKKRLKKLRQKEQKREQANGERADFMEDVTRTNIVPSPPVLSPMDVSDSDSQAPCLSQDSVPLLDEPHQVNVEENVNHESHSSSGGGYPDSSTTYQNVDQYHRAVRRNGRRRLVNYRWQGSKVQRPNGFYVGPNHRVMKVLPESKHSTYRDSRTAVVASFSRVWTPKPKLVADEQSYNARLQNEPPPKLTDGNADSEVVIGSISVNLGNQSNLQQDGDHGAPLPCNGSVVPKKKGLGEERPATARPDKIEVGVSRPTIKLWRPVSRHGNGDSLSVQNGTEEGKVNALSGTGSDYLPETCPADDNCSSNSSCSLAVVEEEEVPLEGFKFSSQAAKTFLGQRWKEAMAASDHVRLVLFPEDEPPGSPEVQDDPQVSPSSVLNHHTMILGNPDIRSSTNSKLRAEAEKGNKVRYILKQK